MFWLMKSISKNPRETFWPFLRGFVSHRKAIADTGIDLHFFVFGLHIIGHLYANCLYSLNTSTIFNKTV